MAHVLILGATGLVGGEALQRALREPRVEWVIAPTRHPLPEDPKLRNPVATELDALLPEAAGWAVDAIICAMGTTMKKAGSKEAFRHVDYDLPLAFGRLACRAGANTFALTSSKGASPTSPFFYTRTKGELERDIAQIGFRSLLIVRPSIIGGDRAESRPAERLALRLAGLLSPILPRGLRVSRASRIAEVLVEGAVAPIPGVRVMGSESLV
jgi:uncharacterized protein YbjT (DUF2867 family)